MKIKIMILRYIFLFKYFNLALLFFKKSWKMIKKICLKYIKLVKIFKYKKIKTNIKIKLNYINKL